MKVYTTDEKELILEPSLKWAANPNILVAVKAFGLKATAQVCMNFTCDYLNITVLLNCTVVLFANA